MSTKVKFPMILFSAVLGAAPPDSLQVTSHSSSVPLLQISSYASAISGQYLRPGFNPGLNQDSWLTRFDFCVTYYIITITKPNQFSFQHTNSVYFNSYTSTASYIYTSFAVYVSFQWRYGCSIHSYSSTQLATQLYIHT